jgi:hypothetical protein
MTFSLRPVVNGLILEVRDIPEGGGEVEEVVYQERYDDEVSGFAEFLRYLSEQYGPSTSRYSSKRIYIEVRPGDKYEEGSIRG